MVNVIIFVILLHRRDRRKKKKNGSIQHLCTNDGGLRYSTSQNDGTFTTSGAEAPIRQTEFQVAELYSFHDPPDIIDRNAENVSYSVASSSSNQQRKVNLDLRTKDVLPPPSLPTSVSSSETSQLAMITKGMD